MNYIEELNPGDCFISDDTLFFLTIDFKKDGSRLAYKLSDGSPRWFEASDIVSKTPIFAVDQNNNFYPLKEEKNKFDAKNL
jgi:hypothetical protein